VTLRPIAERMFEKTLLDFKRTYGTRSSIIPGHPPLKWRATFTGAYGSRNSWLSRSFLLA
jgi:hypothetical protein